MTIEERVELLEKKVEELELQLPKKRFVKPVFKDVYAYMRPLSLISNLALYSQAQQFIDHHEANGWMRGKTKMSNWKAAVNIWISNMNKYGTSNGDSKSRGSEGRMDAIRDF